MRLCATSKLGPQCIVHQGAPSSGGLDSTEVSVRSCPDVAKEPWAEHQNLGFLSLLDLGHFLKHFTFLGLSLHLCNGGLSL